MVDAPHRLGRFAGIAAIAVAALTTASAAQAQPSEITSKIIGGENANIADHPFTVALVTPTGQQFCGGSLAAPNKVVTAAHCTTHQRPSDINVVSGRTVLSAQGGTVSTVKDIWVHPEYQDATNGFDVSVLTLDAPVREMPIVLAATDDPGYAENTRATILGWGNTSEGGQQSDNLRKATVPLGSKDTCTKSYQEFKPDAMVCAGLPEGGVDTCQGDSGGPMVVDNKLIGVTSWGEGCARPGKPGVYARVGTYHDVLMEQIGS
ncbi:S1 family peptidase [Saccharopolyspora phatthalungensis]|uniref:Secreted trypsin-like serine protease n=1 Tax=Saccharopolyspora phatthalungensis TaxID=664693 RepID=A0A840Q4D2_9PSEU|nr:serine protease [Saccharopolyspora phatthalungensis]MBB5153225.1 secreted trypsin-like serine protease [Saccharopolyspora phatthalungensis]